MLLDWKIRCAFLCIGWACTACSSGEPGGGILNVYNWADFIDPSVVVDFEKETGIKVHYDVYETNEMMEVKLLSGHSNYDLVVPGGAFLERGIRAGLYQKLKPNLLPNMRNLDPAAVRATAPSDPGGQYGVDYTWLVSIGLGYNVGKIQARLAQAPLDSWGLLFDPRMAARFADCGISLLDSPDDVVGAALAYLGLNPNSDSTIDLAAAEQVLQHVRRYIRYFDSSSYLADLANGDICLALGWSGDIAQARHRAREARKNVDIGYSIPREGSLTVVDVLAIPADAPHPAAAHRFIDFLLRPDVAARNVMVTSYASAVAGSAALVSEEVRTDEAIYPPAQQRTRLVPMRARSPDFTRAMMRTWTRFKTGQ